VSASLVLWDTERNKSFFREKGPPSGGLFFLCARQLAADPQQAHSFPPYNIPPRFLSLLMSEVISPRNELGFSRRAPYQNRPARNFTPPNLSSCQRDFIPKTTCQSKSKLIHRNPYSWRSDKPAAHLIDDNWLFFDNRQSRMDCNAMKSLYKKIGNTWHQFCSNYRIGNDSQ
jgi:hypothetical protein